MARILADFGSPAADGTAGDGSERGTAVKAQKIRLTREAPAVARRSLPTVHGSLVYVAVESGVSEMAMAARGRPRAWSFWAKCRASASEVVRWGRW